MTTTTGYAVAARGIWKTFGHVVALRGVDFEARAGEVTALIGDNGAGKSSLVKVLSGVHPPDSGELLIDGRAVRLASPHDLLGYGIETAYQDLALVTDLTPYENVFLGREIYRAGLVKPLRLVHRGEMRSRAEVTFKSLNVHIKDPNAPVATLSGGQRQGVAIARAAMWATKLVIMDEPTAALGVAQTQSVLDMIRKIASQGIGVILISHNMVDVLSVADSIHVLRLGERVASFRRGEADIPALVQAMTSGQRAEGTA